MKYYIIKKVIWLGNSKKCIQSLPAITQDILGQELYRVQIGKLPKDWRPMPDIGPGVVEIRVHNPNQYRMLYVANYIEAIYVLHVFAKKTRKTTELDKELGRKRYAELQISRQKEK